MTKKIKKDIESSKIISSYHQTLLLSHMELQYYSTGICMAHSIRVFIFHFCVDAAVFYFIFFIFQLKNWWRRRKWQQRN